MLARQLFVIEPDRIELQEVEIDEDLKPYQALVRTEHTIARPTPKLPPTKRRLPIQ